MRVGCGTELALCLEGSVIDPETRCEMLLHFGDDLLGILKGGMTG